MLREQYSTLMMKGFGSRRHRGLKLLTKWTTINNKVIMPSRHQIVTIDLKSSKKSMLPFWDVYKDRCKNTSRPHKYLGNQANFMKFIRKLNFNLLKLEAVMTQLFSRHSSTPLKLKSILVFIMMKVVRRIELIKVW